MPRRPRLADASHRPLIPVPNPRTILVMQGIAKMVEEQRQFHRQIANFVESFERQQRQFVATIAAMGRVHANLAEANRCLSVFEARPKNLKSESERAEDTRWNLRTDEWIAWWTAIVP